MLTACSGIPRKKVSMSYNKLNPLEKELLINLYRRSPNTKLGDFCAANNVSTAAFSGWLKKYDEGGLAALYRSRTTPSLLPEGVDENEETLRRELIRTKLELERLKKATPGSRQKMGSGWCTCLYQTGIRNHRGALASVRGEGAL